MTSFLAGHLVDSAVSYFHLAQEGWREVGFLQGSPFILNSQADKIVIAKLGVVAAVIGMYALASEGDISDIKSKFKNGTEIALKVGTAGVWAVQAWNLLNIIGEHVLAK